MNIGSGSVLGRATPGALEERGARLSAVPAEVVSELFGVGPRRFMQCVVYRQGVADNGGEVRTRVGLAHTDTAGSLAVVCPEPVAVAVRKGNVELEFVVVQAGIELLDDEYALAG